MKQRQFEQHHQAEWQALEDWLAAKSSASVTQQTLPTEFPQRYRQVCHHLALARDRHYTPYLVERLNRLVLRGHQQLYTLHGGVLSQILRFIGLGFPALVRQEARLVALASLLFFGTFIAMAVSIQFYPELIYSLMSTEQVHQFEEMYDPAAPHFAENRNVQEDFVMFGFYIYNNISIGFQTFAGGILFGLGTLFYLIFNGLFLGAATGHMIQIGYHEPFFSFVAGHSALELVAIMLAGVAGLKLGQGVIAPGRQTRLEALKQAARQSVQIIYGVAGMLLLAAFVEAFWSSNHALSPIIKYTVGITLWLVVIGYFFIGAQPRRRR